MWTYVDLWNLMDISSQKSWSHGVPNQAAPSSLLSTASPLCARCHGISDGLLRTRAAASKIQLADSNSEFLKDLVMPKGS